jgi:hypothetical protein
MHRIGPRRLIDAAFVRPDLERRHDAKPDRLERAVEKDGEIPPVRQGEPLLHRAVAPDRKPVLERQLAQVIGRQILERPHREDAPVRRRQRGDERAVKAPRRLAARRSRGVAAQAVGHQPLQRPQRLGRIAAPPAHPARHQNSRRRSR